MERNTGRIKIADFGLAMTFDDANSGSCFGGSPGFIAPELFEGAKPSALSDIFNIMATLLGAISQRPKPILCQASRWEILRNGAYNLVKESLYARVRGGAAVQMESDKENFINVALAGIAPIELRFNAKELLQLPYLQDTN